MINAGTGKSGADEEQAEAVGREGRRVSEGYWERVEQEMSKGSTKSWDRKPSDEWHPAVAIECDQWSELACVAANALREGHLSLWTLCQAKAIREGWADDFERSATEFFISAAFGKAPEATLRALIGVWEIDWAKAAGEAFLALCLETERARVAGSSVGALEILGAAPGALATLSPHRREFALSKLPASLATKLRTRFESEQIASAASGGAGELAKRSGPKSL